MTRTRFSRARWWIAAILTLLSPWPGPHVDGYLPLGWVLVRAAQDLPDAFFWALASGLLLVVYGLWLAILGAVDWWQRRRRG